MLRRRTRQGVESSARTERDQGYIASAAVDRQSWVIRPVQPARKMPAAKPAGLSRNWIFDRSQRRPFAAQCLSVGKELEWDGQRSNVKRLALSPWVTPSAHPAGVCWYLESMKWLDVMKQERLATLGVSVVVQGVALAVRARLTRSGR